MPTPNRPLRLVLFGHTRSGSTSLSRMLAAHPRLRILEEPFNEGFADSHPGERDYLSLIRDVPSLDEQLAHIFATHNGIKVLDYQVEESLYAHMLARPDLTILFLRRRNALQACVSAFMAGQTGLWHRWDADRPLTDYYGALQPLPIDQIALYLRIGKHDMDLFESVVTNRPAGTWLKLVYEDLYLGPPEQRAAQVMRIWDFLGLDPLPPEVTQRYLDPAEAKLNSAETYRRVPNAQEINARLGSDETGWLFDR